MITAHIAHPVLNPALKPVVGGYNWIEATPLASQMSLVRFLTMALRASRIEGNRNGLHRSTLERELPYEIATLVAMIDGRDFSRGPNSAVAIVKQADAAMNTGG